MNDLELLRPLAVFAFVVDEGSFRAAAQRLGLSAPYVSQLVADLESRLGQQLLYRSTRKIALSSAGERILPLAQQIAEVIGDGLPAFRREGGQLKGQLRLSLPTVLAAPLFVRLLAEFQRVHDKLDLSIILDDRLTDPIDHQIDLTIRLGNPGDDPRLAKKLFETKGVIYCSAQLAPHIRSPEDLNQHRWIKTPLMAKRLRLSHSSKQNVVEVCSDSQLVANNGQLVMQLVAESLGWAVFPEFVVVAQAGEAAITQVLGEWSVPRVGVYALYSARHSSLSNAKSFVDFVVARQHWFASL